MSSLLVLNRVYRRDTEVVLVFSTAFINCCPSNLLSGATLPPSPLPCVNLYTVYTVYTYTVCKGGVGVLGGEGASDRKNTCRKVPLHASFFLNYIWHCILSV